MDRHQVCSNGGPGVQNGPAAEGLGFKNEIFYKKTSSTEPRERERERDRERGTMTYIVHGGIL